MINFGGSLPVENVQALAVKDLKEIPDRYIRPELLSDSISTHASNKLPVIDLSRLLDDQFGTSELTKLHSACIEWGFFQLINHGVSEKSVAKMKMDIQHFFSLPLEDKKAYSKLPNHVEGYGQSFVLSEDQKLDGGDMLYLVTSPSERKNMRFWPNTPPCFRESLEKYAMDAQRVAVCLLGLMAKNLGVEPKKLTDMFDNSPQTLRMNYYPPCPQAADKVLGLSPHSDAPAVTLLMQVNDVEGLQIRKNESWVPVKPISGAFVVNIGDTMEILSNGIYKSIEHRVIVNPKKERLSIGAFHSPNFDTMTGPLPELIKEDGKRYKTLRHEDYIKHYFSTRIYGKTTLELMKLEK